MRWLKVLWRVCCNGLTVKKCFKLCWNVAEKHDAGNSPTIYGCSFLLLLSLWSRLASKVVWKRLHACYILCFFSFPLPLGKWVPQPFNRLTSFVQFVCLEVNLYYWMSDWIHRYRKSVLFLLKHSMELILNLNEANLN